MNEAASSFARGGAFLLEATDCQNVFTPEDFTAEDRAMAPAARDFVDKEIIPRAAELDEKKPGQIDGLVRKAGELGFLGVQVPEQYGGLGTSKAVACSIEEQLGRLGSFAATCARIRALARCPLFTSARPRPRPSTCRNWPRGNGLPPIA